MIPGLKIELVDHYEKDVEGATILDRDGVRLFHTGDHFLAQMDGDVLMIRKTLNIYVDESECADPDGGFTWVNERLSRLLLAMNKS